MMELLTNAVIVVATVALMEPITWFTHKYIMHGFLWALHRDHHQKDTEGFFERNDMFFLIFALPGMLMIYFGYEQGTNHPLLWIGTGVSLYGLCYVLVHDIFIHQRFKFLRNARGAYFRGMRRAHKMHHKHLGKEDGECFGFLWVPLKYVREAQQTGSD